MARLLKKAGDFVLDVAATQYKRSMTRKLNAFGESRNTHKAAAVRGMCCKSSLLCMYVCGDRFALCLGTGRLGTGSLVHFLDHVYGRGIAQRGVFSVEVPFVPLSIRYRFASLPSRSQSV